ncbi:uncharacterized protein AC631_02280 [Debaryomyces fabryi]|uniref:SH3 domain-containing protein n=1 Tax=Debaryomyces fabryi TaxID=58627 RepID=A0A0V1Q150_9ASCO|nr:uncharacterized protein AC631_02280 [Debaryomyces fabryi]KSA01989.1 hypothetical protein AC631_02280 [Debaryomyces fabryi]CUM54521.1 unnamed protein product [Debaryomyces fabryi]
MSIPPLPFKVKTKISWAGEEDGDLGFIENEIVEVYSVVDDSWWNGKLRRNGAEGIFPKAYVEIIEDKLGHNSSSTSLVNTPTKPNTPLKQKTPIQDHEYDVRYRSSKSNTPVKANYSARYLPNRSQCVTKADMSYDYDDENNYHYNSSYDTIEFGNGNLRSSNPNPRKSRSSSKLMSYTNHPKNKHMHSSHSQEDLVLQREKEIEKFKILQQQQHYHIKKIQQLELQDNYRNSIAISPDIYHTSPSSKPRVKQFKPRPQSQVFQTPAPVLNGGNFSSLALVSKESPQNGKFISPKNGKNNLQLFNNHTIESFSPEVSPKPQKYVQNKYVEDCYETPQKANISVEDNYDEIAYKRQQLELELQQLKELEKSKQQQMKKNSYPNVKGSPYRSKAIQGDGVYDNSMTSSYVSEDLLSSKKNYQSKDDLGRKLTKLNTDEGLVDEYDKEDEDEEFGSPPPPPPPKYVKSRKPVQESYHISQPNEERGMQQSQMRDSYVRNVPYDADDFRFSGNSQNRIQLSDEEMLRLSQLHHEELKNSTKSLQSDVLNLSELSATSAGSFIRHKYDKELRYQQELKMKNLSIHDNNDDENNVELNGELKDINNKQLIDSIFQDKKSRHPNIFKKFLQKRKEDEIMNPIEQRFQNEESIDWATLKMDLNRMNSLTSQDKQLRTRRIVREEGSLIVKPLDYISEINTNETIGDMDSPSSLDISDIPFKKIDSFIEKYEISSDLNELISDISVKFNSSKLNQVRCLLLHLCKFHIIEEPGKILQIKPKLNKVLYKGEASVYQLNYIFKKLLDALRIPSEIVLGFWKKPNEFYHNEQYVVNHCWLSILIDNQFHIIDIYCFQNGSVCNIREDGKGFNEYYFMTEPLNLVSTHIPSIIDLQHVVPPIDQSIAFYLPRNYSGFYKNRLRYRNFNNALTRLKDLEFFELELEVPSDVELFTLVKTAKVTTNELSLCQIFWSNSKRIAKIKALLPEKESIGVLQIFAGEKGLQKHFDNVHELSIVIPLYHTGIYKPSKFVPRYPTVQSQNNDLYIKQPQTSKIVVKNAYNFEIWQYPSGGINSLSNLVNQDFKIVIESPSGKYFKLNKSDPTKPFGAYESNVKCQEVGLYRGLVIGDSGNSWYVFAQWDCVMGTVTN